VEEGGTLVFQPAKDKAFFTEQRLRLGNLQIHASMICYCTWRARSLTRLENGKLKKEYFHFYSGISKISIPL